MSWSSIDLHKNMLVARCFLWELHDSAIHSPTFLSKIAQVWLLWPAILQAQIRCKEGVTQELDVASEYSTISILTANIRANSKPKHEEREPEKEGENITRPMDGAESHHRPWVSWPKPRLNACEELLRTGRCSHAKEVLVCSQTYCYIHMMEVVWPLSLQQPFIVLVNILLITDIYRI